MLDNGIVDTYGFLLLFYMPFQFLSPFYFTLFTFHYLQLNEYIKKYRIALLLPFIIFGSYYIFLKVNYILGKPYISQKTINFISAEIEENLTVISLFLLGIWLYRIVRNYEKSLSHLSFSYVTRRTKWLRILFLCNIMLSVLWAINIFYVYQPNVPKQAANYYGLWIAFILFYLVSIVLGTPHFEKIERVRKEGLRIVDDTINESKSHNNFSSLVKSEIKMIDETMNLKSGVDPIKEITEVDREFLKDITHIIEDNIQNPDMNVDFLLNEMHMSRTQLHRRLKSLTGLSTSAFIRTIRVKKAKQLIQNESTSLKQISYIVGFSDPSYFAKCFKKEFAISPSEYASGVKARS